MLVSENWPHHFSASREAGLPLLDECSGSFTVICREHAMDVVRRFQIQAIVNTFSHRAV
jgi:hypothetical protein